MRAQLGQELGIGDFLTVFSHHHQHREFVTSLRDSLDDKHYSARAAGEPLARATAFACIQAAGVDPCRATAVRLAVWIRLVGDVRCEVKAPRPAAC